MSQAYRFTYSNYDLSVYRQGREAVASGLRRQAAINIARAEQIEEEVARLCSILVECDASDPANPAE